MKIKKLQLTQIIKEELEQVLKEDEVFQEGIMDFLRDPFGSKARARVKELEDQIAAAQAEQDAQAAAKATREKEAIEKAQREKEEEQKAARARGQQRSREVFQQRDDARLKFVSQLTRGTDDFIEDFLERRKYYFDTAAKLGVRSYAAPQSVMTAKELRKYVFVRPEPDVEDGIVDNLERKLKAGGTLPAEASKTTWGGSRGLRYMLVGLYGPAAFYDDNNGNYTIVDQDGNVFISYADYRDRRYKGRLNQDALSQELKKDLVKRGYVKGSLPSPMSPENMRSRGYDK
jgi:hypothetical protein